MELNKLYKIVYEDDSVIKVIKGILIAEDDYTLTVNVNENKVVMVGKKYIQKATNIIGDSYGK